MPILYDVRQWRERGIQRLEVPSTETNWMQMVSTPYGLLQMDKDVYREESEARQHVEVARSGALLEIAGAVTRLRMEADARERELTELENRHIEVY
jgi:hypothetical protein